MAESIRTRGVHSYESNLQSPNMSTKCDTNNFAKFCRLFESKLKEKHENNVEAIDVYTEFIKDGESCLNAIDDLTSKQTLHKHLALGYNERGMARYKEVDFDDAVEDFTKALAYNNRLHMTYYNRGLIHYRLGRYDPAIDDMKKALELKQDFDSAKKCLAQAEIDKRNQQKSH